MDELKLCPFCGGEASVGAGATDMNGNDLYTIDCDKCGAFVDFNAKTEREAISAWNTRV